MYGSYNFHIPADKVRYVFISHSGTGMIEKASTWIKAGYTGDYGCKWLKELSVRNNASWTMVAAGNTVDIRNPTPSDRRLIPLFTVKEFKAFQPSLCWCRISQPSIVDLRWSGHLGP